MLFHIMGLLRIWALPAALLASVACLASAVSRCMHACMYALWPLCVLRQVQPCPGSFLAGNLSCCFGDDTHTPRTSQISVSLSPHFDRKKDQPQVKRTQRERERLPRAWKICDWLGSLSACLGWIVVSACSRGRRRVCCFWSREITPTGQKKNHEEGCSTGNGWEILNGTLRRRWRSNGSTAVPRRGGEGEWKRRFLPSCRHELLVVVALDIFV